MPVDRARLRSRVLDRQRTRKYGTLSVKLLTGIKVPYTAVATYSDGWNLEHIEDVTKGADYHKIFIMDLDGSRGANLKKQPPFQLRDTSTRVTLVMRRGPQGSSQNGFIVYSPRARGKLICKGSDG